MPLREIVEEDLEAILSAKLPWSKFDGSTVLITGASGFIGSYIVETLLRLDQEGADIDVVGLVRDGNRAKRRFAELKRGPKLVIQDVAKPLNLEDVDYIIHAASQASPRYYGLDPVGTLAANVIGTYNLLMLTAKRSLQGFLFISSSEVYGRVNGRVNEADYGYLDPLDARSCYAEGKRMGENICVSWFHQHGVPTVIARLFHTYGPGMRADDGRVQADLVADVVAGRDITLKSDGSARRSFCYLADAVSGLFAVLLKGVPGEAYNIGDDRFDLSVRELAERLAELFPPRKVVMGRPTGPYIRSPVESISPDISKARALGWSPNTSLDAGLRRTVGSYDELI